jgi:O-antigen ligase
VFLLWHRRCSQVFVAAGAGAVAVLALTLGTDSLSDFVVSRAGPAFVSTFSLRTTLWALSLKAIQDYKFTGMGMNVFRKLLPIRYPGYPALPGEEVAHAHNHLLQAAIDLGLPGLIAYLSLWIVAAILLVLVYRRASSAVYRVMASGLGAGLIAHFVFGMADVIPLGAKVGVLFWMTLGMVVALHRVAAAGRIVVPEPI